MALLLVGAAAVAGIGLGERLDAVVILAIVVLNALIGVIQEGRAERALDALRAMEMPAATVIRGGRAQNVPSADLVPGDVVLLAAGDRVPADLRLSEAASMEIDESVLTGESMPVGKDPAAPVVPDAPLAERRAMGFSGTLVTRGTGRGIVVATGPRTEIGKIAEHLRQPRARTPLQEQLASLTARLGTIAVIVAAAVFALTAVRLGIGSEGLQRALLGAVALAVAAVPEGLATVVTVALALGVRKMAARGAIVRRLPAVETLGSTTMILTDKTGTLTENRMRVETVVVPGRPAGAPGQMAPSDLAPLAEAAALCNDAGYGIGDPVDVALLEGLGGESAEAVRATHPRLASIPFESGRRRMTTLHRDPSGGVLLFVKGAPEEVLTLCRRRLASGDDETDLTEPERGAMLREAELMAARGMRILALARRRLGRPPGDLEREERDLTLLGMAALADPVRREAAAAVAEARAAGIRLVMVTGDHAGTAEAVAKAVGLAGTGERAVTGPELRRAGAGHPGKARVYARVDPDQKLALVEAGRSRGDVVAVTGDGVNDAPALRLADIGVAMGRTGSDVAREASDLVVTDDNLATIVTAVRAGRGIYDDIRKVVDYLVAGNLSEIAVVVISLLLFPALGIPLLPLQLLWINLLTDGLPAIALALDPVDPGVMARPPRRREERLLDGRKFVVLLGRGLLMAVGAVVALAVARYAWNEPWGHARAVMFTVLVVAHLLSAFVARLPTTGITGWLAGAVGGGIGLQAAVLLWPALRPVFDTVPLSGREWLLVLAAGALPVALAFVFERLRLRRSSPVTGRAVP